MQYDIGCYFLKYLFRGGLCNAYKGKSNLDIIPSGINVVHSYLLKWPGDGAVVQTSVHLGLQGNVLDYSLVFR